MKDNNVEGSTHTDGENLKDGNGGARPQRRDSNRFSTTDFMFGRVLGEGSYARVLHAKMKKNDVHYAIKIMEKRHIRKENKVKHVLVEKNILSKISHEFVVKLWFTFQVQY